MICSVKPGISVSDFLKELDVCRGDVVYHSEQGDCLDLKSRLCKYLFLSIIADQSGKGMQGTVSCSKFDYDRLQEYLISCD